MAKKAFQHKAKPVSIDLALGGGGALGAYQLGAIKAIIESRMFREGLIKFNSVTGTSAGAANTAILVHALNSGAPDLAIKGLEEYWSAIGTIGAKADSVNPLRNPFTWGSSYLLYGAELNGVTRHPLKFLYNTLSGVISDPSKLQNGPVTGAAITATKVDNNEPLRPHNTTHHIHSGQKFTLESVIGSSALETLGTQDIDGVEHSDGAHAKHCNPHIDHVIDNSNYLLIISMDDPRKEPYESDRNKGVWYGEIHDYIKNIDLPDSKQIGMIAYHHPKNWTDDIRITPRPDLLKIHIRHGYNDALDWVEDFETNTLNLKPETATEKQSRIRDIRSSREELSLPEVA